VYLSLSQRDHERVAQLFTLEVPDGPTWVIDPPFDPSGDGICATPVDWNGAEWLNSKRPSR
jgi:hypothetical protein